jgi:8-oxo-dGTP diphosphatase
MKTREGVIIFVIKDNKVLLAKKTRVLGIGKWNGYGGGIDPETDKDLIDCAVREFSEESGGGILQREYLSKVGYLHFHNGDTFEFKAHIFIANEIDGEVSDTSEMIEATWFPVDQIPSSNEFMESDYLWIPKILAGEKIFGHVWYDGDFKLTDRGVEIEVVESFE